MDLFAPFCTKSTSMLRDFKQTEKASNKLKLGRKLLTIVQKFEQLNYLPNSFFHEKIE
jgi:hypothetical protein